MPLLSAVVETNDRLAAIVDHEIDTADIVGRAADHAKLREAASGAEPAAAVGQQHEPA